MRKQLVTEATSLPPLRPGSYAFFFDLDGTLAEIKPQPEQVVIPQTVRHRLGQLARLCDGAVALISGRSMAELDRLAAPLHLPLAGVHGAERRDISGKVLRVNLAPTLVEQLSRYLVEELSVFPGARLEIKGMAFALHYRQAPQHASAIIQLANRLVAQHDGLSLQPGKSVVEIKPAGISKGSAIAAFMHEAPFAGRRPVFLGDDLTDEAGFDIVNELNGVSIKIGAGESRAQQRLQDVQAVYHWLEQTTYQLEQELNRLPLRRAGNESFNRGI
jgi:trehalose 6-phosphate phosphatase|nr:MULTISPECIES: trehalose-phosphatase [Tenebrionibacter/Tenebrionicola group]